MPHGSGSVRSATASSTAHRCATMRSRSVVVVLVAAGAADHDLVLLDRDLDGAVAGPVLGVDGVVLDGGVEPQPVALLAVVERALERAGRALAPAAARPGAGALGLPRRPPSPPPRPRPARSSAASASAALRAASSAALASSSARRTSSASSSAAIAASSSARRSTSSAAAPSAPDLAVGLQAVLALERLDLLDGHLELVGDPGVGATLSHPPTDLVKLRTQRPAAHEQAGRLAKAFGCRPHGARDAMAVVLAQALFGATSSG